MRAHGCEPWGRRFESCRNRFFSVPVAQWIQSARFRPVRPQVRVLPGALVASVAQRMKSGRVLSARSQVRILPGAHVMSYCGEGPAAPPGLIRLSCRVRLPAPQLLMHAEPAGDGTGLTYRIRWVRSPGRVLQAGVAQLVEAPDRESGGLRVRLPLPALPTVSCRSSPTW
jgi:hypothetical protein